MIGTFNIRPEREGHGEDRRDCDESAYPEREVHSPAVPDANGTPRVTRMPPGAYSKKQMSVRRESPWACNGFSILAIVKEGECIPARCLGAVKHLIGAFEHPIAAIVQPCRNDRDANTRRYVDPVGINDKGNAR